MRFCSCLVLFLFIFSGTAFSADEDYSSVIDVDVTDTSAAVAREKAMAQANRQALNNAAANFANEEGLHIIHSLSGEQIQYFIKEATVLEEKSSDVRYIAKLKVTVHKNILRQYLQEKGVSEYNFSNEINVLYNFANLADWIAVEKRIRTIAVVENVHTIAMTQNKVQFKIEYSGDIDALLQTMSSHNLVMKKNGNIYFLTSSDFDLGE